MYLSAISSARSWLPQLLKPRKCLKNVVDCFRSYDASEWDPQLELFGSGIKLGLDIFIPALLLSLIGSLLPSITSGESFGADWLPSYQVHRSMIDSFSPYTPHLPELSSISQATSSNTIQHSLLSNFDLSYLLRLIALSIISPVSMDILFHYFAPILMQTLARIKVVLASHKGPNASTKSALLERVRTGRVIRRHAYDLYLPPKSDETKLLDDPIPSLLFFPGFGIHHSAYADVASQISEYGIPVAMVSLEPLRLAHEKLGGGMNDVRHLIKSAGNDIVQYYKRMRGHNGDTKGSSTGRMAGSIIIEWSIGGHSMGGYNAFQLADELLQTNDDPPSVLLRDGSISRLGSQIVVWAAGTTVQVVPNLKKAGSSIPLRVLVLLGSNDGIAKFASQQQKRELLSKMPKKSRVATIKGGNHSGFASYDGASKNINTMNGTRGISLDSQHKEASRQTANFLHTKK